MRGKRFFGPALVAAGIALAASADVYRWTDAKGIDHYTSDLRQVPAAQRDLARATVLGRKGSLQRIGAATPNAQRTPSPASSGAAHASAPPAAPARDDEVGGKAEAQWRDEAARLRERVALNAPGADHCAEDRLAPSPAAGGPEQTEAERCRNRAAEYEAAQEAVSKFEERSHEAGVPPGWIRE
jgi:hypothetical protein